MDIKITVAGKELLFGRVGFYEHINDVTSEDPIEWMQKMLDKSVKAKKENKNLTMPEIIEDIRVLSYAGINTLLDIEGKDVESFESVKRWVRTLQIADMGTIYNSAINSMTEKTEEKEVKQPGELEKVA